MMKNYSQISNRYMKENKKRTVLTIFGVALAAVLIFAIGTFLFSFRDAMIKEERNYSDYEFMINGLSREETEKISNNVEIKDSAIYIEDKDGYIVKGTDRMARILRGDDRYYSSVKRQKVVEGEAPSNSNEIVVDINTKNFLNVDIGDNVTLTGENGDTEFKVTGITESDGYNSAAPLNIYGYIDKDNLDANEKYMIYVNIKSDKNKQTIMDQVLSDADVEVVDGTKNQNQELLYLTGNGGSSEISKSLNMMAAFMVIVIMVCTITVIYNSFNISVIERIRYFGILKAVGATPKQIKRIIFKEGALIGLIALPLGCIIGFFALKLGIKLFIGNNVLFMTDFQVKFYPKILLVTVVLVAITIFLSIMGPARKAKKVSAVEAMKNNKEINIGKIKRRKGRIVGKIFGVEGSLAYKNIRRTPARFIITVIALTISLIMFNVFYGFLDYVKQTCVDVYGTVFYDAQLYKGSEDSPFTHEEIDEIESKNFSDNIYKFDMKHYSLLIPNDKLSSEYEEKTDMKFGQKRNSLVYNDTLVSKIESYAGGEKEINEANQYIKEGSITKGNGVILVDGRKITNKDGQKETIRGTTYKPGDKIRIAKPISLDENMILSDDQARSAIDNNDYIEVPIAAIAEKDPFSGQNITDSLEILMDTDTYTKYIGELKVNTMLFSFDDNSEKENEAVEYFDSIKESRGYSYYDLKAEFNQINDLFNQVEFFVYCFIIIITIISIVNIFNTISTNILIRKKEFSTLKAIGMQQKQLKKSVILEGTLYGIIASVFGGAISAALLALLVKLIGPMADVEYHFDFVAFIASIVVAILITYLATLIPLKKLSKLSIVEGIRDDE